VLAGILRNEAYVGVYRMPHDGKVYEVSVPPIIERDVFDRAQHLLATL
jgi:hypothetical protein